VIRTRAKLLCQSGTVCYSGWLDVEYVEGHDRYGSPAVFGTVAVPASIELPQLRDFSGIPPRFFPLADRAGYSFLMRTEKGLDFGVDLLRGEPLSRFVGHMRGRMD